MIYPGSTSEFRIFVKENGAEELQIRYVNMTQGYTGKWQVVPKIYEAVNSTTKEITKE